MHARTERMHAGVRFGFCVFLLMCCCAFMASALPHNRKLAAMKTDLSDVQSEEFSVIEREDAKARELAAIESDPKYREIIARDRLDYYEPGEHIFRIEE